MIAPPGWTAGVVGDTVESIRAGFSATGGAPRDSETQIAVLKAGAVSTGLFNHMANKAVIADDLARVQVEVRAGTIVFGRKNSEESVGASAYIEASHPRLYLSDLLWEIQPNSMTDPRWLSYALQSDTIRQRIRNAATGTQSTMKNISQDRLTHLSLSIPPLQEQRKIAELLHAWDDAIARSIALKCSLDRRRDWLRRSVLTGQVRLMGFVSAWSTAKLSELLTEHGCKSTGEQDVYSVSVHKGLINQIEHLGRSFAAADTSNYNLVRPGDVVYTKSPTGEFPLGILKQSTTGKDVIVSPLYGVFTPTTDALGTILNALFESPGFARNYLNPLVQKGAKNTMAITNRRFLEGLVTYPTDPEEQSAIADILDASAEEITTLNRAIAALRTQKQGLMQKLLTGEVRVNVETDQDSGRDQQ